MPGPELPQAARVAPAIGRPMARLRKLRRDVFMGSTVISIGYRPRRTRGHTDAAGGNSAPLRWKRSGSELNAGTTAGKSRTRQQLSVRSALVRRELSPDMSEVLEK
ncbi:hypothetical protein Kisp01_57510 [Kineosporia sp. NBRC 101677]|nr:hypothetical protein Kisp01_57510 [Kineosporia sp. NBRC 101677]